MSGTTSVDGPLDHGRDVVMHGAPGRLVTISPTREGALAFFAFRSPELTDLDFRDSEQHKRVLAGAFANGSWRVPELLERVREADDIYFDSVSQVTLDRWSSGRVALVGDAASSVSLSAAGRAWRSRAHSPSPSSWRETRKPRARLRPLRGGAPQTGGAEAAKRQAGCLASKAPRSVAAKSRAASTGTYVS
jgi:hypothetical protein